MSRRRPPPLQPITPPSASTSQPEEEPSSWFDTFSFWKSSHWGTFSSWLLQPFVQGLMFGLAQHSSKYIVARVFHRNEEPSK